MIRNCLPDKSNRDANQRGTAAYYSGPSAEQIKWGQSKLNGDSRPFQQIKWGQPPISSKLNGDSRPFHVCRQAN
jgi:hypothetical protein